MASPFPVKSQLLHSFNFSRLQWSNDGESSAQHNPLRDSVSATPPSQLQSAMEGSAAPSSGEPTDNLVGPSLILGESSGSSPICECMIQPVIDQGESVLVSPKSELGVDLVTLTKNKGASIEYQRNHSRNSSSGSITNGGISSGGSEQDKEKFVMKSDAGEADVAGSKRAKILIRFPCKNIKEEQNPQGEQLRIDQNDEHGITEGAQDEGKSNNGIAEETKTWNLRPRKSLLKRHSATVSAGKSNESKTPPLMNSNRSADKEGKCSGGSEKKVKRKLSISIALTKEEIEEDICAMTGSKPARKPKKRAKNIQKHIDTLFPGSWLVSITPDTYKV